jgi:predicted aminopeptidase
MLTESCVHSRGLLRASIVALTALLLSGCGALYVAQAARGQMQLMRERRPIEVVLQDAATPAALRDRLQQVRSAREFASSELALPNNGSYRSYADIGRRFVVWNVVAAPEFSVEPQRWCFPIVGCVAYRGYFSEKRARAYADTLRRRGFDTMVAGVPAYSTLGRFADPVINTMMSYGELELVGIIFHELAHQLVYVGGDSAFNEAFAVTVERAGLERWLSFSGREADIERWQQRRSRQREYLQAFARRRGQLAALYALPLEAGEMRRRKQQIFSELAADIDAIERRHGVQSGYRSWVEHGMNNANLVAVATYHECAPGFERLLEEQGGDLLRFYAQVRALARLPGAQRRAQLCGPLSAAE